MGLPLRKNDVEYTCRDYWSWPDDERWELIDGVAYNMSPAPRSNHQKISTIISGELYLLLKSSPCNVYSAPFDVYFPQSKDTEFDSINTIVQPDISVICDPSKLTDEGCMGAPDLVVEILSPSTGKKDLNEKYRLYEREGVKEYWVVDPGNRYIRVFRLIYEGVKTGTYDEGELTPPAGRQEKVIALESRVVKGFTLHPDDLFSD